jgi:hypothetical protein
MMRARVGRGSRSGTDVDLVRGDVVESKGSIVPSVPLWALVQSADEAVITAIPF